jgi:hypothetical protein
MTTLPHYSPLNPDRLGPWLAACGFSCHQLDDYLGAFGRCPAIVHVAHPGHTVAITEQTDPNDPTGRVYTELTVYPAGARRIAVSGGPVQRIHAQLFDVAFAPNTPPPVIYAAAVAALIARPNVARTR